MNARKTGVVFGAVSLLFGFAGLLGAIVGAFASGAGLTGLAAGILISRGDDDA